LSRRCCCLRRFFSHHPEAGRVERCRSSKALARRFAVAAVAGCYVVAATAFAEPNFTDPFNLEAFDYSVVDFELELVAVQGQVVEDPSIVNGYPLVCYCHIITTDLEYAVVAWGFDADCSGAGSCCNHLCSDLFLLLCVHLFLCCIICFPFADLPSLGFDFHHSITLDAFPVAADSFICFDSYIIIFNYKYELNAFNYLV